MNRKREVPTKVEVILESGQAELVEGIVETLYSIARPAGNWSMEA